jgi:hypothetical protein
MIGENIALFKKTSSDGDEEVTISSDKTETNKAVTFTANLLRGILASIPLYLFNGILGAV